MRMNSIAAGIVAAFSLGASAFADILYEAPPMPNPQLQPNFIETGLVVGQTLDPYHGTVFLVGDPPGYTFSPLRSANWTLPTGRRNVDADAVNQQLLGPTLGFTRRQNLMGQCAGRVPIAPDLTFQFRSNGQAPLFVSSVTGEASVWDQPPRHINTTLVVHWRPLNEPNAEGYWYCSGHPDDTSTPVLQINNAADGVYSVWIGIPDFISPDIYSGALPPAEVYISSQRPYT